MTKKNSNYLIDPLIKNELENKNFNELKIFTSNIHIISLLEFNKLINSIINNNIPLVYFDNIFNSLNINDLQSNNIYSFINSSIKLIDYLPNNKNEMFLSFYDNVHENFKNNEVFHILLNKYLYKFSLISLLEENNIKKLNPVNEKDLYITIFRDLFEYQLINNNNSKIYFYKIMNNLNDSYFLLNKQYLFNKLKVNSADISFKIKFSNIKDKTIFLEIVNDLLLLKDNNVKNYIAEIDLIFKKKYELFNLNEQIKTSKINNLKNKI